MTGGMEHSKTCNFVSCYVVLSRPYKVQHFVARHVKTIGQQDPSAGIWYATYAYSISCVLSLCSSLLLMIVVHHDQASTWKVQASMLILHPPACLFLKASPLNLHA